MASTHNKLIKNANDFVKLAKYALTKSGKNFHVWLRNVRELLNQEGLALDDVDQAKLKASFSAGESSIEAVKNVLNTWEEDISLVKRDEPGELWNPPEGMFTSRKKKTKKKAYLRLEDNFFKRSEYSTLWNPEQNDSDLDKELEFGAGQYSTYKSNNKLDKDFIINLQKFLIILGKNLGPHGADGILGDLTKGALAGWQKENNLPATGNTDKETMELLVPQMQAHGLLPRANTEVSQYTNQKFDVLLNNSKEDLDELERFLKKDWDNRALLIKGDNIKEYLTDYSVKLNSITKNIIKVLYPNSQVTKANLRQRANVLYTKAESLNDILLNLCNLANVSVVPLPKNPDPNSLGMQTKARIKLLNNFLKKAEQPSFNKKISDLIQFLLWCQDALTHIPAKRMFKYYADQLANYTLENEQLYDNQLNNLSILLNKIYNDSDSFAKNYQSAGPQTQEIKDKLDWIAKLAKEIYNTYIYKGKSNATNPANPANPAKPSKLISNIARARQKLKDNNYVGREGAPLIIDGIIGPNTQFALDNYKYRFMNNAKKSNDEIIAHIMGQNSFNKAPNNIPDIPENPH